MQHVVEAVQIGAQYAVPILVFQRGEGIVAREPRIQHHAVIRAMRFNIRFQHAAAFGAVGHVKLQYPCLPPQRADLFRHRFGIRHAAAAVHHNVEAVLCQGQSGRTADAAGGAGDEDGLGHDGVL